MCVRSGSPLKKAALGFYLSPGQEITPPILSGEGLTNTPTYPKVLKMVFGLLSTCMQNPFRNDPWGFTTRASFYYISAWSNLIIKLEITEDKNLQQEKAFLLDSLKIG